MPHEYISVTETAKLVRADLKKNWPMIKFSVRSSKYSLGASIDVYWTDGPTTESVDIIIKRYEGASFDGSIDLMSYHDSALDGRKVRFSADFVFAQRSISREEEKTELAKELLRLTCDVQTSKHGQEYFGKDDLEQLAHRILWAQDYCKNESLMDARNKALGI